MKNQQQAHNAIANELIKNGQLIKGGFEIFRGLVISPTAPAIQVDEMRLAFMAGAQHLYSSIMSTLDDDTDPTDNDMRRMHMIDSELTEFAKALNEKLNEKQPRQNNMPNP